MTAAYASHTATLYGVFISLSHFHPNPPQTKQAGAAGGESPPAATYLREREPQERALLLRAARDGRKSSRVEV